MDYRINKTNFGANYINSVKIKKLNKRLNIYLPHEVSFIELDNNNIKDYAAILSNSESWLFAPFIRKIFEEFKKGGSNVYALTTQKADYMNLDPKAVLGYAQTKKTGNKSIELCYLQVNPLFINVGSDAKKNIKGCGKGILKSLKKIYNKITLISCDDLYTVYFYIDNGFKQISESLCRFEWRKSDKNLLLKNVVQKINNFIDAMTESPFSRI